MDTYTPRKCDSAEYKNLLEEAKKQTGKPDQQYKCVKNKLTITLNGVNIIAYSTFIFDLINYLAYLTEDQIKHFSDKGFTRITCDRIPNLTKFVKDQNGSLLELPFTLEAKRPLYLPVNKSVAAGVVLAFYNGTRDPVEKIMSLYGVDVGEASEEITRILTTYYMCCIKYLTV